jgi:hypothetical protein
MKVRSDLLKWKLVVIGSIGATVFSGGIDAIKLIREVQMPLLGFLAIVCVYIDALCEHLNIRIIVIGTYFKMIATKSCLKSYEKYAGSLRNVYELEDNAMRAISYGISISIALLLIPTDSINKLIELKWIDNNIADFIYRVKFYETSSLIAGMMGLVAAVGRGLLTQKQKRLLNSLNEQTCEVLRNGYCSQIVKPSEQIDERSKAEREPAGTESASLLDKLLGVIEKIFNAVNAIRKKLVGFWPGWFMSCIVVAVGGVNWEYRNSEGAILKLLWKGMVIVGGIGIVFPLVTLAVAKLQKNIYSKEFQKTLSRL